MRISDWSSDVCSSDLRPCTVARRRERRAVLAAGRTAHLRQRPGADRAHAAGRRRTRRRARAVARIGAGAGHAAVAVRARPGPDRSEEHTSELQSLMRISYAVFCLKKKTQIISNLQ